MLNTKLIKSLTDLRTSPAGISQLAKDEGPVYIFNRNKPISVVMDIKDYDDLIDRLEDSLDAAEIIEMKKTVKPEDLVPWEKIKKDLKL